MDADDEADGIYARWADFGDWQAPVDRPLKKIGNSSFLGLVGSSRMSNRYSYFILFCLNIVHWFFDSRKKVLHGASISRKTCL